MGKKKKKESVIARRHRTGKEYTKKWRVRPRHIPADILDACLWSFYDKKVRTVAGYKIVPTKKRGVYVHKPDGKVKKYFPKSLLEYLLKLGEW